MLSHRYKNHPFLVWSMESGPRRTNNPYQTNLPQILLLYTKIAYEHGNKLLLDHHVHILNQRLLELTSLTGHLLPRLHTFMKVVVLPYCLFIYEKTITSIHFQSIINCMQSMKLWHTFHFVLDIIGPVNITAAFLIRILGLLLPNPWYSDLELMFFCSIGAMYSSYSAYVRCNNCIITPMKYIYVFGFFCAKMTLFAILL